MRFAQSLLLGLLVGHGLAQTAVEPVEEQPSAVAPQNPSEPAAEEPSAAAPVAEPTQDNSSPEPTADTKEPAESAAAPQESEPAATGSPEEPTAAEEEPSAGVTATNNDSEPTKAPEATGTAEEASATAGDDDSLTATGEPTGTATEQEETGATKTESSVPTATSAVVKADLKNATVSENAEIVEVEGKPAVKLSAPVDGEATFSVSVDTDDDFDAGEKIHIVASIFVGEPSGSNSAKLRRRGRKTDCNLQMKLNGQTVYDEPLETTDGKWQDVSSTGLQSSDPQPKIDVTQKCGKTPAPLTVNNVQVANENGLGSSSGGSGSGSGGSGSGSGTGSGSSGKGSSGSGSGSDSKSGSDSSSSDDDSAGSKAATSMVGLVAAMAAAMLFM
ncbi:Hypothetical protein NCS54_01422200 [Fusarium falciforme]|uniref:Hypothetical protein n=1 Tax=Fusarium falciforme TaxID=195108 RepID=UPI00230159F2|nr:Hypothetical protein NCS54_01422200 [Fusarium falciforme]WAO96545.1 Hypothetical protein NCS54_01422200 [Fusarium falciforme]